MTGVDAVDNWRFLPGDLANSGRATPCIVSLDHTARPLPRCSGLQLRVVPMVTSQVGSAGAQTGASGVAVLGLGGAPWRVAVLVAIPGPRESGRIPARGERAVSAMGAGALKIVVGLVLLDLSLPGLADCFRSTRRFGNDSLRNLSAVQGSLYRVRSRRVELHSFVYHERDRGSRAWALRSQPWLGDASIHGAGDVAAVGVYHGVGPGIRKCHDDFLIGVGVDALLYQRHRPYGRWLSYTTGWYLLFSSGEIFFSFQRLVARWFLALSRAGRVRLSSMKSMNARSGAGTRRRPG